MAEKPRIDGRAGIRKGNFQLPLFCQILAQTMLNR